MLPETRGKTYIQRIVSVYSDLFKDKYGFYPTVNYGQIGKLIQQLIDNKTELQIASLLIVFFDWAGITGGDEFERDKLLKACYPFGWFYSSINQYEVWLRNVYKLEFDNEEVVREFVAKSLLSLKK